MVFRRCASLLLLLSVSEMSSAPAQTVESAIPDSLQPRSPSHSGLSVAFSIVKVAGDEVCFTLTARDRDGNVIADWNTRSEATTLTLLNSTANTDSSARSWNADRKGYTWAAMSSNGQPLAQAAPHEWLLPAAAFDSLGKARICLTDSKAESGVEILVGPAVVYLNQRTDKISFIAGPAADYLVEVTAQVPDRSAVYHERPYEIVVTPRDRYTNTASEAVPTRLLARWPDEMDESLPDLDTVFSRDVTVAGQTSFIIASRFVRELPKDAPQFVIAHRSGDFSISGRSNDYEILSHPPYPFKLLSPMNHRYIRFYPGIPSQFEVFSWEKPLPIQTRSRTSESLDSIIRTGIGHRQIYVDLC
ncbi:MAG: hypothetical protein IPP94_02860 [Ignavibacteria bacterium]|nr:hypothetical protein [Ignavibacteria bacterium]